MCILCSALFDLSQVRTDCLGSDRRSHVLRLVDAYDRAWLVLTYSVQYVEEVCDLLERNRKRADRIGLGGNSAGIVSGVAGVVAAATVFTPVGPPLLVAAMLFGGSATACSTGSKNVNYCSSPSRLAARIMALHAMVKGLLLVMKVMDDAMIHGRVDAERYVDSQRAIGSIDLRGVKEKKKASRKQKKTITKKTVEEDVIKKVTKEVSGTMNKREREETMEVIQEKKPNVESPSIKEYGYSLVDQDKDYSLLSNDEADWPIPRYVSKLEKEKGPEFHKLDEWASYSNIINSLFVEGIAKETKNTSTNCINNYIGVSANTRETKVNKENGDRAIIMTDDRNKDDTKVVAKKAGFLSRISASGASLAGISASLATYTGGALGAATVALEVKDMVSTIRRMKSGSPCNRVSVLRFIVDDLDKLPDGSTVAAMCERYTKKG